MWSLDWENHNFFTCLQQDIYIAMAFSLTLTWAVDQATALAHSAPWVVDVGACCARPRPRQMFLGQGCHRGTVDCLWCSLTSVVRRRACGVWGWRGLVQGARVVHMLAVLHQVGILQRLWLLLLCHCQHALQALFLFPLGCQLQKTQNSVRLQNPGCKATTLIL